jgi:hypothetical protein
MSMRAITPFLVHHNLQRTIHSARCSHSGPTSTLRAANKAGPSWNGKTPHIGLNAPKHDATSTPQLLPTSTNNRLFHHAGERTDSDCVPLLQCSTVCSSICDPCLQGFRYPQHEGPMRYAISRRQRTAISIAILTAYRHVCIPSIASVRLLTPAFGLFLRILALF